jgi:hypothetical protein
MRPPRVAVATAVQRCARSDWTVEQCAGANRLAWLSVQDKMNFARLHGAAFHLVAVEVRHLALRSASSSQYWVDLLMPHRLWAAKATRPLVGATVFSLHGIASHSALTTARTQGRAKPRRSGSC